MPIDAVLLERFKNNDPTLTTLDLNNRKLDSHDIQQLVDALVTNTTLTTLNVEGNNIGDEGAKALAANTILISLNIGYNQVGVKGAKALAANTTLTTLNVGGNFIGDEGAKALADNATLITLNVETNKISDNGARALATNITLTTLYLNNNLIGAEGAKALAVNKTLTALNIKHNNIDKKEKVEVEVQVDKAIAHNRQQIERRRAQFIQTLMILAHDKGNRKSQSLWSQLPQELMQHIISLIDFRPLESIGKRDQQIKACAEFMFNNVVSLKESLAESITTKQNFKLREKIVRGESQFQFFPPTAQIQTELESKEKTNTIKNTV